MKHGEENGNQETRENSSMINQVVTSYMSCARNVDRQVCAPSRGISDLIDRMDCDR